MLDALAINNELFTWVILPILIFFSKIMDVTLGTLRIIYVSRGKKYIAPVFGFFEVLIWVVVISSIMKYADNIVCYIAYAGGFAAGNFVGMLIEEKLALGVLSARIFVIKEKTNDLMNKLCEKGFGITIIEGMGKIDKTNILFCIFRRKELNQVTEIIESVDANLFYSIEDLRHVSKGVFLPRPNCKKK
ncbi:MAG: DUF2179 domain-containing protein [Clostridia bacterium]|nr:DUF2179 domain-containing protein [Clostridia bacterium]